MSAFLAVLLAAQRPTTAERAERLVLPAVEFSQTDVREALRTLFRQGLFGGTIAPDVQGQVTVSLRNVPWTMALQNITRQVDATYRIENGFFEIVRREEFVPAPPREPEPDGDEVRMQSAYRTIVAAISAGQGSMLRQYLDKSFEARDAFQTRKGDHAVRSFVESFRSYPQFVLEDLDWGGKQVARAEVLVSYRRPGSAIFYYRDLWQRFPNDSWRLYSREEVWPEPPLRFMEAPLSEVLTKVFRRVGASWALDPSLDRSRKVSVDLTGMPFERALSVLTHMLNLTYRIEGGVYTIVPRR